MVGARHRGKHPFLRQEVSSEGPFRVGKRVGLGNEELDQIMGERVGRSVGPAPGADLRVDVGDVAFDGPDAHKQLFGDLVVGTPPSQVAQHLYLPRRKTVWITSGLT